MHSIICLSDKIGTAVQLKCNGINKKLLFTFLAWIGILVLITSKLVEIYLISISVWRNVEEWEKEQKNKIRKIPFAPMQCSEHRYYITILYYERLASIIATKANKNMEDYFRKTFFWSPLSTLNSVLLEIYLLCLFICVRRVFDI